MGGEADDGGPKPWFDSFPCQTGRWCRFHVIVVVGTLLTLCLLGAKSIEKTNKVMMPLFFLIFLVLTVRGPPPRALEGYQYMLPPVGDLLDPMVWIWHGAGVLLPVRHGQRHDRLRGLPLPRRDVVSLAKQTALFDTIAALVARR